MVHVYYAKVGEGIQDPVYQYFGDAGFDLRADESLVLDAGEFTLIPTGLRFQIPQGYEMQIRSRSGLAGKYGVFVLNSPGTVDSTYRGEVCVILCNAGKHPFEINRGDRIAQAVINEVPSVNLEKVDLLESTFRDSNGFGSTGVA